MKILAFKILLTLKALILLWVGLVKNIALPTNKRKGNLLSSFFDLVFGTIEKLELFQYGSFKMKDVFHQAFVRKVLLVTGCFILLVTCLEWEHPGNAENGSIAFSEISSLSNGADRPSRTETFTKNSGQKSFRACFVLLNHHLTNRAVEQYFCSTQPLYLRIRSLRI